MVYKLSRTNLLKTKYYHGVVDSKASNLLAGCAHPVIIFSGRFQKKIIPLATLSNSNKRREMGFYTRAV